MCQPGKSWYHCTFIFVERVWVRVDSWPVFLVILTCTDANKLILTNTELLVLLQSAVLIHFALTTCTSVHPQHINCFFSFGCNKFHPNYCFVWHITPFSLISNKQFVLYLTFYTYPFTEIHVDLGTTLHLTVLEAWRCNIFSSFFFSVFIASPSRQVLLLYCMIVYDRPYVRNADNLTDVDISDG